jgi:CreA protein
VLLLTACGRSGNEVGEFKNDWVGNEIKVEALADPKVAGVTCHLTHFDRGFWDRAAKGNWFEDPSNASIACRQTGPIVVGDIDLDKSGEEVFSQRMSLVFKSIAVRRILDAENKTLVYVVYSRRPVEGSAKMSVSTISLYGQDVALPASE